jgi:hypothetical protein
MSSTLRIKIPARARPPLPGWVCSSCAFACFVAAGQILATRVSEFFDVLNYELSWIQDATVRHPSLLASTFVALGVLSLAVTRVRGPRAALVQGLVIAPALGFIVFVSQNLLPANFGHG